MRMFFEKCCSFYLRFRKIMLPLHNVKSGLHFLRRMNNMTDSIRHSGIVDSVGDDCVRVRILQTSACASCKVAGYCNASESKEKVIDVYGTVYAATVKVGDHVVVTASREVAFKALLWAFGVPFIILVAVLFSVVAATSDETVGALSGMAALAPYYLVLYFLRGRMRSKMTFRIEKD